VTRLVVGPFNRVEGDLEVRLDVCEGRVREAHVTATMYRGFEQILPGRDPMDALVIVPRICGICSVSQSVAAARALGALAGATPPPNGERAIELMLATENLADHLTHFYLFFMPDFARPAYAGRDWHATVVERFGDARGTHSRAATAARQRWMELMGTLGGRWPHTGSVLPGGSARAIEATERLRLRARVAEMRRFLEQTLFGAPLEAVDALPDARALAAWHAENPMRGDLALFMTIAGDLGLAALGRGPGRYLAYRPPGLWDAAAGAVERLEQQAISEDAAHSWFADSAPRHPQSGLTEPDADKPGAYSWCKAPRLDGRVVETGALARQLVTGHPLLRELAAQGGGSVYTRVLARLIETAQLVPRMEAALDALVPREPFYRPATLPEEGRAFGLAEAARGALGHWLEVRGRKLARYQIVAPTSWNFSPRDASGMPGALETALIGTPVADGETTPVAVQHVVRSFDPCMVCTVH
jgi:uptake hydrogenase large subunit